MDEEELSLPAVFSCRITSRTSIPQRYTMQRCSTAGARRPILSRAKLQG